MLSHILPAWPHCDAKVGVHRSLSRYRRGYFEICSPSEEGDDKEGFDLSIRTTQPAGADPDPLGANQWPAGTGSAAKRWDSFGSSMVRLAVEVLAEAPPGNLDDANAGDVHAEVMISSFSLHFESLGILPCRSAFASVVGIVVYIEILPCGLVEIVPVKVQHLPK